MDEMDGMDGMDGMDVMDLMDEMYEMDGMDGMDVVDGMDGMERKRTRLRLLPPRSRRMPRWCSLGWPVRCWTARSKRRRRHLRRKAASPSGCIASALKGESMAPDESIVEGSALTLFGDLDHAVGRGSPMAPGEIAGGGGGARGVVLLICG